MARPVARRRGLRIDDDAHVGCDGALRRREDRVEIELGDLGEVGGELRHALDQQRERLAVDALRPANASQHVGRCDAVEHRQRIGLRHGGEPERHVLQHLDQHAPEPERDELAERRIGDRADDDLLAALQHLLDLHADEAGLRVVPARVRHDRRVALLGLRSALDAHEHAAGLGLVQDLRRDDLQHDGEAHLAREPSGLRGGLRDAFPRHRDAVGVADELALGRRQRRASLGDDLVDELADRCLVVRHEWFPQMTRSARSASICSRV